MVDPKMSHHPVSTSDLLGMETRIGVRIDRLEDHIGRRLDGVETRVDDLEATRQAHHARREAYATVARGVRTTLLVVATLGGFVLGVLATFAATPGGP